MENKVKILDWGRKENIAIRKKFGRFARIPVIVDMQNDFVKKEFSVNGNSQKENGKLVVAGATEIIPRIAEWIGEYRKFMGGIPIIYTQDWHPKDAEEFKVWPEHCVVGTAGAEIVQELAPAAEDIIVRKNANAAFTNPNILDLFETLEATELIVAGVATDYCVKAFAIDAAKNGFDVVVKENLIKGVDLKPGDVDKAIAEMKVAGVKLGRG